MSKENIFNTTSQRRDYPDYTAKLVQKAQQQHVTNTPHTMGMIIVPQSRSVEGIIPAARLAHSAGASLIALCSHQVKASQVAEVLSNMSDGPHTWFAIDVPPGYEIPNVDLVAHHEIPSQAKKVPGWNLSTKRNIGLMIAKQHGTKHIFFHDDDLEIDEEALASVEKQLQSGQVVISGLRCGGFPDKSVLMHAQQVVLDFHLPTQHKIGLKMFQLKAGQASANSMGVDISAIHDHFPPGAYNEDWLFMRNAYRQGTAGLAEGFYYQADYDPFDPERARQEEFGEILIDGLYGKDTILYPADETDPEYWQAVIDHRYEDYVATLEDIVAQRNKEYFLPAMTLEKNELFMLPEQQKKLTTALMGGLTVHHDLTGEVFVNFMRAWEDDRLRWKNMWHNLENNRGIGEAISKLGLEYHSSIYR